MHNLRQFVDELPYGAKNSTEQGRLVFGKRPIDTIPYRIPNGAVSAVPAEDVQATPVSSNVVAKVFDLSKIKDTEEYQSIRNAVYSGWYKELYIERRWIDNPVPHVVIYIEFAVRERFVNKPLYYYDPLYDKKFGGFIPLQ
jgi:hypothetical protein